jgi:hypothetical protein
MALPPSTVSTLWTNMHGKNNTILYPRGKCFASRISVCSFAPSDTDVRGYVEWGVTGKAHTVNPYYVSEGAAAGSRWEDPQVDGYRAFFCCVTLKVCYSVKLWRLWKKPFPLL